MWGKILAGAAIGVGAIAAAPFTGGGSLIGAATLATSLTGAGTIAAATGAGLTGAVIGGAIASSDADEKRAFMDEGRVEGRAENLLRIERLEKELNEKLLALESHDKHFNAIIALEAVGVSCAACDGDFSENEKEEIGEFVKGMLAQSIPEEIKERIQFIYNNPPTVKEAFLLAEKSDIPLDIFEDLIQFVMEIDGIKKEEQVFVQAWDQLKAA